MSHGGLDIFDERGASYVMVMFAIVVLGTISFSFLTIAALETEAAVNYRNSAGARFAARAGLNKAVWRIMNETNFVDNFDGVSISDTFQGMPIQYMVEKAANNESVVATSTGTAENATSTLRHLMIPPIEQTVEDAWLVAYGEGTELNPRYRTWQGAGWSAEANASQVNNEISWSVLRRCPGREEKALGTLEQGSVLNVQFWNGAGWGSATQMGSDSSATTRSFDIAYESVSGDALIAYGVNSDNTIHYRVWNGTSWSSESALNLSLGGDPKWVVMASDPNSDEIVLAVLDSQNDIGVSVWNGGAFANTTIIEREVTGNDTLPMDVAYESTSGRAMVAWTENNQKAHYAIWDGAAWLGEAVTSNMGQKGPWLRLASDPSSNRILSGLIDKDNDINVMLWDGTSWGAPLEVETNAETLTERCFDVAFEGGGGQAIAAWSENNAHAVEYRIWTSGVWSAEQTGSNLGNDIKIVQLKSSPLSDVIFMTTKTDDNDLQITYWDGAVWDSPLEIETNSSGSMPDESFMASF
ncbi:MAG: hypothetical protein HQ583_03510 [Candidatus Abyssubacteria bacterium]|nr:hypothetical protein [Candidatus Abyssubacteria bacterium]